MEVEDRTCSVPRPYLLRPPETANDGNPIDKEEV